MRTIRIYSDESRHKNERFLLLGGVWVPEEKVEIFENAVAKLRSKYGHVDSNGNHVDFLGEFKWQKVSDKYLQLYKELVDLFFKAIDKDLMRACIMLVDTNDPGVVVHSNIKNQGYFKLLYQLYLHNSHIPAIYKIFPDKITNPAQQNVDFETLDSCLEAAFVSKFIPKLNLQERPGGAGFVNNITPIDSKNTEFIQILDVVMGSVGYYQNGLYKRDEAKKAKVALMKYIFNKIVLSGAFRFTGKSYMVVKSTKLNIWLFRPKNKKSSQ